MGCGVWGDGVWLQGALEQVPAKKAEIQWRMLTQLHKTL
jgi:hypothetical protein